MTAWNACEVTSTIRLSKRSAMTPPHAPKSSVGRNWSTITRPTANPLLCDRSRTSQLERDGLHPGAAQGRALAEEVVAVVADLERPERRRRKGVQLRHQCCSRLPSPERSSSCRFSSTGMTRFEQRALLLGEPRHSPGKNSSRLVRVCARSFLPGCVRAPGRCGGHPGRPAARPGDPLRVVPRCGSCSAAAPVRSRPARPT